MKPQTAEKLLVLFIVLTICFAGLSVYTVSEARARTAALQDEVANTEAKLQEAEEDVLVCLEWVDWQSDWEDFLLNTFTYTMQNELNYTETADEIGNATVQEWAKSYNMQTINNARLNYNAVYDKYDAEINERYDNR